MKKNKKYSLSERIKYYSELGQKEYERFNKTGITSKKLEFATGYVDGARRGLSSDFKSLSKAEQKGQMAGAKAREKSLNIKF